MIKRKVTDHTNTTYLYITHYSHQDFIMHVALENKYTFIHTNILKHQLLYLIDSMCISYFLYFIRIALSITSQSNKVRYSKTRLYAELVITTCSASSNKKYVPSVDMACSPHMPRQDVHFGSFLSANMTGSQVCRILKANLWSV